MAKNEERAAEDDDAPVYKPRDDAETHYWEPGKQRAEGVPEDVEERAWSNELQRQAERRAKERVEGHRQGEEGPAARGSSIADDE